MNISLKIFALRNTIICLLTLIALTSCDYYYGYNLNVTNATDDDLLVQVYRLNEEEDYELIEEVLILPELKSEIVYLGGGNCGKCCPVDPFSYDFFSEHWRIDSLSVLKNSIPIDYEYINKISNWDFSTECQTGIYEIEILNSDFE
ncbi:hypothetical protein [Winogradskyella sp. 3972H.M.0a.05]|uniref:hypothetical protein n=1 Tax=Winogradskyella sp. 3972H.M.0a.05 TaxID=2950277 RepID=UPI0033989C1D